MTVTTRLPLEKAVRAKLHLSTVGKEGDFIWTEHKNSAYKETQWLDFSY